MLETMIRLSTAFAKIRFGKKITTADAEKAYSLLSYAKPQERLDSNEKISFQQSKQRLRQSTQQQSREEDEEDTTQTPAISVDRFSAFRRHLRQAFDNRRTELMSKDEAIASIQEQASNNRYSNGEIVAALERLSDENSIMMADGNIFLI
ncbi:hypothetical protein D917_08600 [Trichinella nativa]|uniref:Uncharacterized protein n=1 Tax=Trichinella nativa TaxID=6335 RepID=A0A1Y3EQ39_9BILA|nr:hypothetical protein D917_08600 [Trichinella nativa]